MTATVTKKAEWHDGLTARERKFCEEYLVDLNVTAAGKRAGFSEATAAQSGWRMRNSKKVKDAIDNLFEARGISSLRIVEELAKVAFGSIGDFVKVRDGKIEITDFDKLTPEQIASLGTVTETISEFGTSITIKPYDKVTALAWLGKAKRLFVERAEISGPNGGSIPIEATITDVRAKLDEKMARLRKALAGGDDAVESLPPKVE